MSGPLSRSVLRVPALAAALAAFALGATGPAQAGTVAAADSSATLNGAAWSAKAAAAELKRGDTLRSGSGPARVRPVSGGDVALLPGTTLRFDGAEASVEHYFVVDGEVQAKLSGTVAIGTGAGWMSAASGGTATVRVQSLDGEGRGDAWFGCAEGGAWIRYHAVAVWLPAGAAVTLRPGGAGPGSLVFESARDGRAAVEVVRDVASGGVALIAAPGVSGSLADLPGGKSARFACRDAPPGVLLAIEERRGREVRSLGEIAAGVAMVLDREGRSRLEIPGVDGDAVGRLRAQTREFSAD